ncbi:hypothetical protein WAI453_004423 [Rhynchosporium graminicola]
MTLQVLVSAAPPPRAGKCQTRNSVGFEATRSRRNRFSHIARGEERGGEGRGGEERRGEERRGEERRGGESRGPMPKKSNIEGSGPQKPETETETLLPRMSIQHQAPPTAAPCTGESPHHTSHSTPARNASTAELERAWESGDKVIPANRVTVTGRTTGDGKGKVNMEIRRERE